MRAEQEGATYDHAESDMQLDEDKKKVPICGFTRPICNWWRLLFCSSTTSTVEGNGAYGLLRW
eukprot:COSAG05_NODE_11344_length_518_cov_0.613365_2_plen_62_part_01